MGRKYNIWVFVAVVVLLPISVFGFVKLLEQRYQPLPVLGPKNHKISPFSFTNQNGKTLSLKDCKDKIVVVGNEKMKGFEAIREGNCGKVVLDFEEI